jgi:ribosomal protein S18 acetylase RimI-like enzyme
VRSLTTVRPAVTDDARTISEVRIETWRYAYVGVIPQHVLDGLDVARGERWFHDAIDARGFATFVAEQHGRIVGFASVGPCRDREGMGELYAVYVRPAAWGTGAGLALMDEAVEWLRARWDEAVLWVATENPRARRFYERYGWIPEDERVEEVAPGAFVPEVRYRLSGLDER